MRDYEDTRLEAIWLELEDAERRKDRRRENRAACDALVAELERANLRWDGNTAKPRCAAATLAEFERLQVLAGTGYASPRNTIEAHERVLNLQQAFMLSIPGLESDSEDSEWQASATA